MIPWPHLAPTPAPKSPDTRTVVRLEGIEPPALRSGGAGSKGAEFDGVFVTVRLRSGATVVWWPGCYSRCYIIVPRSPTASVSVTGRVGG